MDKEEQNNKTARMITPPNLLKYKIAGLDARAMLDETIVEKGQAHIAPKPAPQASSKLEFAKLYTTSYAVA